MNTHSLDLEAGSSQYAYRADSASLSISEDLTIECYIKPESLPGTTTTLVSKWNYTAGKRSYSLEIGTGNQIVLRVSNDGAAPAAIGESTTTVTIGVWQHIAVSYGASAGTCKFYKTGSYLTGEDGSGLDTAIHDNDSNFDIGCQNSSSSAGYFWDGLIDEIRVWNDIRTAQEIADNYNKELVGNEAGLAGYWKLNNSYLDETTNDNDLTAVGSPVFSTDVPFVTYIPRHGFVNHQNPGIV